MSPTTEPVLAPNADFTCPRCNREREFSDLSECVRCAEATEWSLSESLQWVRERVDAFRSQALDAVRNASAEWDNRFLRVVDSTAVVFDGNVHSVRHILFAVLETFLEGRRERLASGNRERLLEPESFVQIAEEIGRLRLVEFELKEGNVGLVEVGPRFVEEMRPWMSSPPWPLTKTASAWKTYTRVHLGAGRLALQEPELWRAFGQGNPDASLTHLASALGLNLPQFTTHHGRAFFRLYAPRMHAGLGTAPPGGPGALHDFCASLEKLATPDPARRPFRMATMVPARRFKPWLRTQDNWRLAPLLTLLSGLRGAHPICPIVSESNASFLVCPNLSFFFRTSVINYSETPDGIEASKAAADGFEILVAALLKQVGMTVEVGSETTVGVKLSRQKPEELDVFAWNDSIILGVEVKYELEPPGAWSEKNIQARTVQLESHWRKLTAKVKHWEDTLMRPPVTVHNWLDKTVVLPAGLRARPLIPLLVSARVEPAMRKANVVSLIPSRAAEVMRERIPAETVAPWWSGREMPPTNYPSPA